MKYICNLKGDTTLYPTDPKDRFHFVLFAIGPEKAPSSQYQFETLHKTRAKIDEAIARTAMLKEANFYPKLFGQVEEIEEEKVKEFEESLNKYLAPYLENALETGWLIGKLC